MVNKVSLPAMLLAVWALFSCGKQTTENQTTIIDVSIDWGTGGAPAAGVIDSIRITVATSQSQWSESFPYSAHKGSVSNVPQNAPVIVTVEGIKNPDTVVYLGVDTINKVADDMSITVSTSLVHPGLPPIVTITNPSADTTVDSGTASITIAGTIRDTGGAGIDSLIANTSDITNSMNAARTTFFVSFTIAKDTGTVVVTAWSKGNAGSDSVTVYRRSKPVQAAPSITKPPRSQTVMVGQSVTFDVTAAGTAPLSYQWHKDTAAISGATLSSYSISNVKVSDTGTYTVTIANGIAPNAISSEAVLAIETPEVMKYITGGTFTMGSSDTTDDYGAYPPHQVTISAFWMDSTDVTQAQYVTIMDTNPSYFSNSLNNPVEQITWFDAVRYCVKKSIIEGLQSCYDTVAWTCDITKNGYRLPTEAEWEYACRAGTATAYYWGAVMDTNYCWFDGNSGDSTHAVATRWPNAWGLYDMSGNVWQWCNDWYGDYTSGNQTDPTGPASNSFGWRVMRGGSWNADDVCQHPAFRTPNPPDNLAPAYGFRCVHR